MPTVAEGAPLKKAGRIEPIIDYISSNSLAPGTYNAVTSNDQSYFDELYDDIDCASGCNSTTGTPIAVAAGATTAGIDFALVKGGTITGSITDAVTGAPLEDIPLSIFVLDSGDANWVSDAWTDAAGHYVSERPLVTGLYAASTGNWSGYIDELYDVGYCLSCWPGDGTPIAVTTGAATSGVDFALDKGATVSGQAG